MKVLHVIGGDLNSGAAKGALLLHQALINSGLKSSIFTNSGVALKDPAIDSMKQRTLGTLKSKLYAKADKLPKLFYPNRERLIFSTGLFGFDLQNAKAFQSADIIHLHWVNAGLIKIKSLKHFDTPIVWTLRDMWPMTGGCHYSLGCERFRNSCGKCPQLRSKHDLDLSRLVYSSKKKHLPESITVVGTSEWMSNLARQSSLLKKYDISTIHNGIDTEEFQPTQKAIARQQLGIPLDKNVLLFGAQYVGDPFKGLGYFKKAIKILKPQNTIAVLFGNLDNECSKQLDIPVKNFGFIGSSEKLALLYSAADVFVAPSQAEAFGKTTVEANACGTPVVCFDAAGQSDIVRHQISGYKARPYDAEDLAFGIDWILADNERHENLCLASRKIAVENFDIRLLAQKYIKLYRTIF